MTNIIEVWGPKNNILESLGTRLTAKMRSVRAREHSGHNLALKKISRWFVRLFFLLTKFLRGLDLD